MSFHIAIDARVINSGTGTYVVKLLEQLERLDTTNRYSILVPTKDRDYWQPHNPNFTIRTVDFANYSLAEQLGFRRYLDELGPDLVHFLILNILSSCCKTSFISRPCVHILRIHARFHQEFPLLLVRPVHDVL